MNENQPTTRQLVLFTLVLSFIVSVIGTILTLGVLGPIFSDGEENDLPFVFNRPKILEKITERVLDSKPSTKEPSQEELLVRVVEEVSPAVVSVVATKDVPVIERFYVDPFANDPRFKEFFGENGSGFKIPQLRQKGTETQEISAGSGFVVSSDGLILTNKHVVSDTQAQYTVLLNDGSKKTAKVLARDPVQDLAILKIDGSNYRTVKLADSAQIKIGQSVVAIGNALGEFSNTVSVGIISGLHRSVVATGAKSGPETLQELIQTDAAINPGNSGGPLLNLQGEVIGINTAVAEGAENIGFAIPINSAKRDIENVKQTGKIIYPYLGVLYIPITKDYAEKEKLPKDYGAYITGGGDPAVLPGSPAAKAGIREKDIILELSGERVDQGHTLASLIQKHQVGEEVTLKIFRDGKEIEVKVKLEERK